MNLYDLDAIVPCDIPSNTHWEITALGIKRLIEICQSADYHGTHGSGKKNYGS